MTTRQLIKLLQEADPEGTRIVILQKDPEGNGYHEAQGAESNVLWNRADRDLGYEDLTLALQRKGFTEEDLGSGKKAVVIFP
jgi:hypothetical protein